MDPLYVVLHVVHSAENPATLFALGASPLAADAWIVLGLVAGAVLFAGEATGTAAATAATAAMVNVGVGCERAGLGLRTAFDAAKEVLGVVVEVLAEVAASREFGL